MASRALHLFGEILDLFPYFVILGCAVYILFELGGAALSPPN